MPVTLKRYRALRPVEYPTDQAVIRKIRNGEAVSYALRKNKRVKAGDVVTDIPNPALLIEKGWIEEVKADDNDE